MRARIVPALLAAGLAAAPASGTDFANFLPRSLDSGAWIEFVAVSELDDYDSPAGETRWTDDFFRQRATLFSRGYVYHPRFLLYDVSLSGALKQEGYERTSRPHTGRVNDEGYDYTVRPRLLPEHPYNFEVFALRWEPLERDRAATSRDTVATSNGADIRYRDKPYFFRAHYTDNRYESTETFSDVERLGLEGEYIRRFPTGTQVSLQGSFAPERFDHSSGLTGSSHEALAAGELRIGRFSLHAGASDRTLDQEGGATGRFESRQTGLYGRLGASLPWHFRSLLSYRRGESRSEFAAVPGGSARAQESDDRNLDFELHHRLYQSLRSSWIHRRSERFASSGDSEVRTDTLQFLYDKSIPRGTVEAGYGRGWSRTENHGQTVIAQEPHNAVAVPGTFQLGQPNVDSTSIVVFLRSPIAPFETLRLEPDVHYVLAQVGDSLEIWVLDLPPQFALPGSFDFLVDYRPLGGDFRIDSDQSNHSVSLRLFDNLLNPYYSYFRTDSSIVEGAFPGGGLDTTRTLIGLRLLIGPLRLSAEHQDVTWDRGPYHGWRYDLQYVDSLGIDTTLHATASYRSRVYPEGRYGSSDQELAEITRSASANIQQKLLRRRLVVSIGGTYGRTTGYADTETISGNASLSFKIGRFDLSAGATVSTSDANADTLSVSHRDRRHYYLRLRRDLF